jgi:hypothetical protein
MSGIYYYVILESQGDDDDDGDENLSRIAIGKAGVPQSI